MNKLLISACFLGHNVRYNGQIKPLLHRAIDRWQQQGILVPVCPEVAGGLATPREPAECQANGKIITVSGRDVSAEFLNGARQALKLCQHQQIRYALLKEASPSCGRQQIYDGSFSGTKKSGMGITSQLLIENGIKVFSEQQLGELIAELGYGE